MKAKPSTSVTIEDYIATFPAEVQVLLEHVKKLIQQTLPDARPCISYQIPCFKLAGSAVIYFAAYPKHLGLYPAPIHDPALQADLAPYASGQATARFLYSQDLPTDLIVRIIQHRARELAQKASAAGKTSKQNPSRKKSDS